MKDIWSGDSLWFEQALHTASYSLFQLNDIDASMFWMVCCYRSRVGLHPVDCSFLTKKTVLCDPESRLFFVFNPERVYKQGL